MERLLDSFRRPIRSGLQSIAVGLNRLSRGKISPDAVTLVGFAAHVPIAILIGSGHHVLAAVLLVFFGLFDGLDGALARLQKRASQRGMLLDASTDRMKEVLLYTGAAFFLTGTGNPRLAVWAVAACGASLCVSYVKAKGEAAMASKNIPHDVMNRLFQDGLMRFEVRMAILALGLAFGFLDSALVFIAIMATYTALRRLIDISKKLT